MQYLDEEGLEYVLSNLRASHILTEDGRNVEEVISILKTNLATSEEVQEVKDIVLRIEELLDPLLINSFTNNINVVESGGTINSITFNWEYTKDIKAQYLNGTEIDRTLRTTTLNILLDKNTTFTLTAVSNTNKRVSSTTSVTFANAMYYGASSSTSYNNDFISSLTKKLGNSKSMTVNITTGPNQYMYFAFPVSLGEPIFTVNTFEGGFIKVDTIRYTNDNRATTDYNIYRSDYPNLGKITVSVK